MHGEHRSIAIGVLVDANIRKFVVASRFVSAAVVVGRVSYFTSAAAAAALDLSFLLPSFANRHWPPCIADGSREFHSMRSKWAGGGQRARPRRAPTYFAYRAEVGQTKEY